MQENEPPQQDQIKSLQQQVRMLRILVLILIVSINVVLFLFSSRRSDRMVEGTGTTEQLPPPDYVSQEAKDELARTKAVVLADYKDLGSELHMVVREILWVAPGAVLDRPVGEEIGSPMKKEPGVGHGDSVLVFCKGPDGKPLEVYYSTPIYGGKIAAFGMRLEKFRELVEQLKKEEGQGLVTPRVEKPGMTTAIGSWDSGVSDTKDPKEALRTAKAVVLTEYQDRGTELRPVIKEILWMAPGVTFRHKVGDEFGMAREKSPVKRYGDGTVIFCEQSPGSRGGPVEEVRNVAVYAGRIPAFEMKLEDFRKLVEELPKEAAGAPQR